MFSDFKKDFLCLNQKWDAKCPDKEVIVILWTQFGLSDRHQCASDSSEEEDWEHPFSAPPTSCKDPSVFKKLQRICWKRNYCFVDDLHNDCWVKNDELYLEIHHVCVKGKDSFMRII